MASPEANSSILSRDDGLSHHTVQPLPFHVLLPLSNHGSHISFRHVRVSLLKRPPCHPNISSKDHPSFLSSANWEARSSSCHFPNSCTSCCQASAPHRHWNTLVLTFSFSLIQQKNDHWSLTLFYFPVAFDVNSQGFSNNNLYIASV